MENNIQQELNVLLKRRHEELAELKNKGVQPFAYSFEVDSNSKEIKDSFKEGEEKNVKIAGRLMALRRMGKASFAHIQDQSGRIQIYLKKDEIGESYSAFKLMDIGDIIGVEGFIFKTKTGEISVHVKKLELLTKSMRPLPIAKEVVDEKGNKTIFDQFADKELRYRQRYVDLIVNPEIKGVFIKRSKIISAMRSFLDSSGYLEVETPILQPLYGGAAARPFITHHNTLDTELYLRIADELYLKRLIVGGFDGVYEISKDFRNEGMDRTHNPEFTMMELYVSYKDYDWMMNYVEKMLNKICMDVFGTTEFTYEGNQINFKSPWKRLSMIDAIKEETSVDVITASVDELKEACKKYGIDLKKVEGRTKLIDELFSVAVQPKLIQPTFIIDYPIELSPLAKKHRSKQGVVERFEGYAAGRELCNAFSELNDPMDQKERFEGQVKMEYGMPPTAGLGIGVDRLVMILANQSSIRDVIFFPQMRPEVK